MSKPLDGFENFFDVANDRQLYDIEKIQGIIKSLDFLRSEAKKAGSEEVVVMINSAFSMVLVAHYHFLNYGSHQDIKKN